jgi:hypothetical protein
VVATLEMLVGRSKKDAKEAQAVADAPDGADEPTSISSHRAGAEAESDLEAVVVT